MFKDVYLLVATDIPATMPRWSVIDPKTELNAGLQMAQVETLKATTGGKPITYKIAYGLPVEVMLEWGLYISKPRCG